MDLYDYIATINEEYEQLVNEYGFNSKEEATFIRNLLLSFGNYEYTEEVFYHKIAKCLDSDAFIHNAVWGYLAGYDQKDVIKMELQNRYLLEIDESKEKPIIVESYKAWLNLRTHELTARIHTEPKWEWRQIQDYRVMKDVNWYDLVDKYAEEHSGRLRINTRNFKKEVYIRNLLY